MESSSGLSVLGSHPNPLPFLSDKCLPVPQGGCVSIRLLHTQSCLKSFPLEYDPLLWFLLAADVQLLYHS